MKDKNFVQRVGVTYCLRLGVDGIWFGWMLKWLGAVVWPGGRTGPVTNCEFSKISQFCVEFPFIRLSNLKSVGRRKSNYSFCRPFGLCRLGTTHSPLPPFPLATPIIGRRNYVYYAGRRMLRALCIFDTFPPLSHLTIHLN